MSQNTGLTGTLDICHVIYLLALWCAANMCFWNPRWGFQLSRNLRIYSASFTTSCLFEIGWYIRCCSISYWSKCPTSRNMFSCCTSHLNEVRGTVPIHHYLVASTKHLKTSCQVLQYKNERAINALPTGHRTPCWLNELSVIVQSFQPYDLHGTQSGHSAVDGCLFQHIPG